MLTLWIYGWSETFKYKSCLWACNYRVSGITGMWRGWTQTIHTSHMVFSDFVQLFKPIVYLIRSSNPVQIFPTQNSLWHSLPEGDSAADAGLTCPMLILIQQCGWLTAPEVTSLCEAGPPSRQGRSKEDECESAKSHLDHTCWHSWGNASYDHEYRKKDKYWSKCTSLARQGIISRAGTARGPQSQKL